MNLFTYGSLMVPSVMEAVTGRTFSARRAALADYVRFRVSGASYPGIVPRWGVVIDGVVYLDVDAAAVACLDAVSYTHLTLPTILRV